MRLAGERWPSWCWRPWCGFAAGALPLGVYVLLPALKIPPPAVPGEVWLMFGGILGVASWHRGAAQAAQAAAGAPQTPHVVG